MTVSSLLLFLFCLLVSFLYAGIEAGLLSLNRARLRSRIHQGEHGAVRLGRLLSKPGRLLATVLLVTNFADVAALVLITDACVHWFGVKGYLLAGIAMLPVYLLVLQLLPKSLFRRFPYRATAALAGLLEGTVRVLGPVLSAGRFLLGRILLPPMPAMGKVAPGLFTSRQDFKSLADEGERSGALSQAEHRSIANVLDFQALTTGDLAEPLPEAFHLPGSPDDLRVADLLATARLRELDYLPVFDGEGRLLALLDVFALLLERVPARPAAAYLRRVPLVVAPTDPAWQTLRRLRAVRLPAAVVQDAEGRPRGLVRTRELLARLVRQKTPGETAAPGERRPSP